MKKWTLLLMTLSLNILTIACSQRVPKDDFNYPLKAHDITQGAPPSALKSAGEDLRRSSKFSTLTKQVMFEYASADLTSSSKQALDEIAQMMISGSSSFEKMRIAGFTDASGSSSRNLRLSQLRADNVRKYLISKGVPANKIEAIGMGSISYDENTADAAASAMSNTSTSDRRVDFEIVQ
ncbi:MAG TPA: OmpA family protein [Bdellovibrio sp.]|nr:OmpA family protein [Bdellovibrio sp.]